jgi:hypothetical protein
MATTTLIVVTSNLEPPATSSINLFLIDLVCQLELLGEERLLKNSKKHPFEQGIA